VTVSFHFVSSNSLAPEAKRKRLRAVSSGSRVRGVPSLVMGAVVNINYHLQLRQRLSGPFYASVFACALR